MPRWDFGHVGGDGEERRQEEEVLQDIPGTADKELILS